MTTAMTGIDAATRACPNCGNLILEKALQCLHCRKWLPEALARPEPAAPEAIPTALPSRGQSLRNLLLLTVFTGGLYEVYWFYRNWHDLDDGDRAEFAPRPALLTIGLLIPFLNVALVYRQLDRIRGVVTSAGLHAGYSAVWTTFAYFALGVLANLTMLWALSLLMVLPLLPVQDALNRYWSEREPGTTLREELTPRELAAMALGASAIIAAMLLEWAAMSAPK